MPEGWTLSARGVDSKCPKAWLLNCVAVLCDLENLTPTNHITLFQTAHREVGDKEQELEEREN